MPGISRFMFLLLCTAGAAQAAEPMKELGIPLGKKLRMPIERCPSDGPGKDATSPCWVKAPTVLKGGVQSGALAVPAAVRGQPWTAPGTYVVTIDGHGVLHSVTVHSARAEEFAKISGSLTARLGKDLRSFSTDQQRRTARWEWKDAVIDLDCQADVGCATRFSFEGREQRRLDRANRFRMG